MTNKIIFAIASCTLFYSYFLPFIGEIWSPYLAAKHLFEYHHKYPWHYIDIDSFPFLIGIIFSANIIFHKFIILKISISTTYLYFWVLIGFVWWSRSNESSSYSNPTIWSTAIIIAFLILAFYSYYAYRNRKGVFIVEFSNLILSISSLFHIILLIIFARNEDNLLLNYGAPLSLASISVIFLLSLNAFQSKYLKLRN